MLYFWTTCHSTQNNCKTQFSLPTLLTSNISWAQHASNTRNAIFSNKTQIQLTSYKIFILQACNSYNSLCWFCLIWMRRILSSGTGDHVVLWETNLYIHHCENLKSHISSLVLVSWLGILYRFYCWIVTNEPPLPSMYSLHGAETFLGG